MNDVIGIYHTFKTTKMLILYIIVDALSEKDRNGILRCNSI